MALGRTLEQGLTNRLYANEIADLMERFEDAGFQIQVWRDLAVARYKLYDALGMWWQSRGVLPAATYSSVRSAADAYLDQTLAAAYFRRMAQEPYGQAPPLSVRHANYATRGFVAMSSEAQLRCVAEFCRESLRSDDWFYSLMGGRVFAAENETGGYTLMLAGEY